MQRLKINKNILILLFSLFCLNCGEFESDKEIAIKNPVNFFYISEIIFTLAEDTSPRLKISLEGNPVEDITEFYLRADCFYDYVRIRQEYDRDSFAIYRGENLLSKEQRTITWNLNYFYYTNKIILKINSVKINEENVICDHHKQDCQIHPVCLDSIQENCYIPHSYEY
jgi:hypothetical protein